ncbi:MAG: GNAT family N-acetyltransferase [Gaiellaceae bacterium]
MIEVREVVTDEDVATYLDVRNRVHPATPMPLAAVLDQRRRPDNLDLIAEVDRVPAGVATTDEFGGSPGGDLAYVTIRVVPEQRRRGVGTALHRRASKHARGLGKARFYAVVRHDDPDSLAYYDHRGFEEVGRMQDVTLELAGVDVRVEPPDGIRIAEATEAYDRGAYEVALEADADVPSGEQFVSGTFGQWRDRTFGPLTMRELSFVALDGGRVVGYAVVHRHTDDEAQHAMTGVARAARGRGIALALKQAQIAAAKGAGLRALRTQNDLSNTPMRRVNEKLGYVRTFEWVHLTGPLLPR